LAECTTCSADLPGKLFAVPPKPIAPNKAVPCPECGWTTYPRPEQVVGKPSLVRWTTPENCGGCGAMLEVGKRGRVTSRTSSAR
jgi:DNA-directed RNA polymerase subunit RPC12/RpoP